MTKLYISPNSLLLLIKAESHLLVWEALNCWEFKMTPLYDIFSNVNSSAIVFLVYVSVILIYCWFFVIIGTSIDLISVFEFNLLRFDVLKHNFVLI